MSALFHPYLCGRKAAEWLINMKKVVSLLLTLVLMVGLLSTAVFAEEGADYDVIRFEQVKSKKSDKGLFTLTSTKVDVDGWYCGGSHTLTIIAENGLTITRIEAEIGYYFRNYSEVGVSGDAVKNNSPEKNGDTVIVSQINSSEFSFTGGSRFVQFKNIKVYYCTHSFDENGICELCHYADESKHEHIFDDNNVCACGKTRCGVNGHTLENGICEFCHYVDESKHEHIFDDNNNCACGKTKCDVGEHVLENGLCKFCDFFDESKHEQHIFDDDNNCACGKTKCDVEGHSYVTICQVCGAEAPENYVPEVSGGYTASTLSQGNMTIVVGIACVALGLVGGLLIGKKKKKSVPANAHEEEIKDNE